MFQVVLMLERSLKQGFKGRNRRFTRRYETIQLPMQPQLSESTAVSWGGDSLNAIQAIGAQAAQGAIEKLGMEGDLQGAMGALGGGLQNLGQLAKDDGTQKALAAFFCWTGSWC